MMQKYIYIYTNHTYRDNNPFNLYPKEAQPAKEKHIIATNRKTKQSKFTQKAENIRNIIERRHSKHVEKTY